MKAIRFITILSLLFFTRLIVANAQTTSHWSCDVYEYEYDMAVCFSLIYNDEAVNDIEQFEVAAFCNNECRGIGEFQTVTKKDGKGAIYGYIRIHSNQKANETIRFMVYDKSLKLERNIMESLSFANQELVGIPSNPIPFNFYEDRPVTITVKDCSRIYGDDNPSFEYTVEGVDLIGVPQITCEVQSASPAGEYPIIVTKGSLKNINVTYVNGTLTVEKAPLAVSVGKYAKKQGETNPEFVVSYDGFKNNETKDVLIKQPTVSCEAIESTAPGEYPIIISGGEAQNYEFSYISGTLTINPADPIKLTAKSYTREYGDADTVFEYTVEGAALDGEPEIICEATATSPAGEYPIIIRKGGVKNYNDTYVNGVLTITKAPLTICIGNFTKKQYDPMPEFAVQYEGFKNNETKEVLTKQPIVTCEANEDSAPGEYPIVVSGAEATNYQIQYVAGKLTVTEPDSYTLTYIVDGEVYQSFTVKYRDAITPLEAPTKEGYTFSGWSGLPRSMPAKDVTVKGTFTANSYTVTFMDGDKVLYTEEVNYGEAIPIPEIYDKYGLLYKWLDVPETMPAHDVIILVDETDMIDGPTPAPSLVERGTIYDMNGRRLSAPLKGINIIRMSDGTSRKVMVK